MFIFFVNKKSHKMLSPSLKCCRFISLLSCHFHIASSPSLSTFYYMQFARPVSAISTSYTFVVVVVNLVILKQKYQFSTSDFRDLLMVWLLPGQLGTMTCPCYYKGFKKIKIFQSLNWYLEVINLHSLKDIQKCFLNHARRKILHLVLITTV